MVKERRFRDIIAELSLIVIGVSLALFVENAIENAKEKDVEKAYVISFQQDWQDDKKQLINVIKQSEALKERASQLHADLMENKLTQKDAGRVFSILNYQFFNRQDFTLQSIREAGEFRLLNDESFKHDVLKMQSYHLRIDEAQRNYQQALDSYLVPMAVDNIDLGKQYIANPDFLSDFRFHNIVLYTINDLDARIVLYKRTLEFIESLEAKKKS